MAYDDSRLDDYVDVPARIREFREKWPNGSLRPLNPTEPYKIETIGDQTFIVVVAAAYRSPEDVIPGVGMAWEQFPGRTPYTKFSELQNAETSAWGRAIVAVLAADTKKIASREEVQNRRADHAVDDEAREAARRNWVGNCTAAIANAETQQALDDILDRINKATGNLITVVDSIELRRALGGRRDTLPADPDPHVGADPSAGVDDTDHPAVAPVDHPDRYNATPVGEHA